MENLDKSVRRELSVHTYAPEAFAITGLILNILQVLSVIHWEWWVVEEPFVLSLMSSFYLWFFMWLWKQES